jgi:hypothetical protein
MSRAMVGTLQTHKASAHDVLNEAGLFGRGAAYWRRFYFYYFYACVSGRSLHARSVTLD